MNGSMNGSLSSNVYDNNDIILPIGSKRRKYRSWVWEYFIPTDRKTATCSICQKVIVHGNPTSHLINHLTKVHNLSEDSKLTQQQQLPVHLSLNGQSESNTSVDNDIAYLDSPSQNISGQIADLVESSASSFDNTTKMLIEFFVSINQPFSVFDNDRLRNFLSELNMNYVIPSARTVEYEYLPELMNLMQDEVRDNLANVDHIAITINSWTSNENLTYSVITAHYIYQFEIKHRILSFKYKNEDQISEDLNRLLENEWNIFNKISCIVDETTTSIQSNQYLEAEYLPCSKSLINMCANGLFENQSKSIDFINQIVLKSKKLVTAVKQSGMMALEPKQINTVSIGSDWVSTYNALNWILKNTEIINGIANDSLDSLTAFELEILQGICSILEPLNEIYDEISNTKNVTIGFIFPAIYSLVNYELPAVQENFTKSDLTTLTNELIASLKSKFDFVFNPESPLQKCFLSATLLDCRFKQFQFIRNEQDRFILLNRAKSCLIEFHNAINTRSFSNSQAHLSPSDGTIKFVQNGNGGGGDKRKLSFVEKMMNRFPNNTKLAPDNTFMIELDTFMAEPSDSIQSTLDFYRLHDRTDKFPNFIKLANFFFSLPVVSVFSNSLVNYCNEMERQGINPHALESLVFVKNNLI